MPIKFDRSATSILVLCTECPPWFSLCFTPLDGYRAAELHEVRVHDVEPNVAASPRRLYEERHAVDP